ncbi:MAG: hypothetical protein OEY74_10430, partial [Gammaproteobacteria bacterium]|nr:hypothetical protein [Gammaproteobacteria bacterium]
DSVSIGPGDSINEFIIRSDRPPTIRAVSLTPFWVLVVDNHDDVTDQELEDAANVRRSISVTSFALGPAEVAVGGFPHYSRISTDMRTAQALGWATDAVLVDDLEAHLGTARDEVFIGNNGLAIAELEAMLDLIQAAPASSANQAFRDLVVLNVEWLIERVPNLRNTYIPVFTASPLGATQERDSTFTLTMEYYNSALEDNPPLGSLNVLVRCVQDRPCANADQLLPGVLVQFDATGPKTFGYVGNNTGLDVIEVVERDFEVYPRLALLEVEWTADADLVVPAFVPPVILAGSGDTIYVSDRTSNVGTQDVSSTTTTRYFISDSDLIDVSTAVALGERVVPPLAAGQVDDSLEMQFTIPGGLIGTVQFLAACADADADIPERNENNNCSFSELEREFDVGMVIDDPVVTLPSISVSGASSAEGDTGTTELAFDVRITAPDAANDVSVRLRTLDGSALDGQDYNATDTEIVFPAGTQELSQSVPVVVIGDFDVETDETFDVELYDPSSNATISSAIATGTIENDDLVAVTVGDVAELEGDAGSVPFVVSVSIDQAHPTESVTVDLQTNDISATAPSDYESSSVQLSFAPGTLALSQSVSIDVYGDTEIEADEQFELALIGTSANAMAIDAVGVATILNDDLPPQLDCTPAFSTPSVLWPPNHKLVPVSIGGVFATNGELADIIVTTIEQDEPVNGLGDGDTSPDAVDVGTDTPSIRRERSGTGDGRVYILSFEATDSNTLASCSGILTIGVPHDQGQGAVPIDSGDRFNSTGE